MSDNFIISIVLTAMVTYYFTKKQMNLEDKRKAYSDYLIALQDYINNNDFMAFQKATNNIILFASERTAKLVNKYFADVSTLNDSSLSAVEHSIKHNEIIKSMRKDLGFLKNNIERCSLYRFDLQKPGDNTTLYVGVTNDLIRRVYEHKNKLVEGFTKRYNLTKLVYYEVFEDITLAIKREKQLKGGSRQKKIDLINSMNKEWIDLYDRIIE